MKKLTKLLTGILMALTVFVLAGTVNAQASAPGTVRVETSLNLRSGPGTSNSVIGSLSNGQTVTVLGNAYGWYNVSAGGKTGWISGHYLTMDATVNVSGTLNIRSAASSTASIVGSLYDGTIVTVTDLSASGYYRVSYYGGTGWVSGKYVTPGKAYAASASAQTVIDAAQRVIGVRYAFGGDSVGSGFDCSGLTKYAYAKIGVTLPHSSAQQAGMGTAVDRANLKPGDLVFFDTDGGHNNVTHEGLYIGGGNFVNAESGVIHWVSTASLDNSYWSSVYMGARRIVS